MSDSKETELGISNQGDSLSVVRNPGVVFRVRIKHIAIAKCNPFFHYRDGKEISFYYFHDAKLCAKHEGVCNSQFILLESCL